MSGKFGYLVNFLKIKKKKIYLAKNWQENNRIFKVCNGQTLENKMGVYDAFWTWQFDKLKTNCLQNKTKSKQIYKMEFWA